MKPLPSFKDTLDAFRFGRNATPVQIEQLRKRREKFQAKAEKEIKAGRPQDALVTLCFAQFYREAIQAWTEKELAIV